MMLWAVQTKKDGKVVRSIQPKKTTVPADLVDQVVLADGGGRRGAEAVLGEHLGGAALQFPC